MSLMANLPKFGIIKPIHQRRILSQVKRLAKDSEHVVFDDKVLDVLEEYTLDRGHLNEVRNHLNDIDYAQSRKEASQLLAQIGRFKSDHAQNQWSNPMYRKAFNELKVEFEGLGLKPLQYTSDADIVEAIPKTSTHAGETGILSGRTKKGENLENIFQRFMEIVEAAKQNLTLNRLMFVAVRTQNSSPYHEDGTVKVKEELPPHSKTRMVSMVDLFQIILELMFQKPIQGILNIFSWYAGGKTPNELRKEIHYINTHYYHWVTLDYSHYDASLPGWLIRDAFTILQSAFNDVDAVLWNIMVHDFVNKTFVGPDGNLVTVHDGVPSGSMFTQIIDTICNRLMVLTYLHSRNFKNYRMCIMGDDNVIGTDYPIDKEDIGRYLSNVFGIEVNVSKTTSGTMQDSISFLSRVWRLNGEWRHPNTLITKLLYPERFREYDSDTTPYHVILSYILSYPLGMRDVIDVSRFLRDHRQLGNEWLGKGQKHLVGNIKLLAMNNVNWELAMNTEWSIVYQSVA